MAKDLKALNRSVAQLAKQITKTDLINADDASVATESSNETQPRSIKSASGTKALYPICIKRKIRQYLIHGNVDICVQYHGLMHIGIL